MRPTTSTKLIQGFFCTEPTQLKMKFSKPTTTSSTERRTTGSFLQESSVAQISVTRPDQFRNRFAITFDGDYLGLDDALQMRLFLDPGRAHLFTTSERAWEIVREMPELGGKWVQRTKFDVVPLYLSDPVRCIDAAVRQ